MPRRHESASPDVACIWLTHPDDDKLWDAVASRLICWASAFDPAQVKLVTYPTLHFEVPKAYCTGNVLKWTDGGADVCPIGDDVDVAAATQLSTATCQPDLPPDELSERLAIAEGDIAVLQGDVTDLESTQATQGATLSGHTTAIGSLTSRVGALETAAANYVQKGGAPQNITSDLNFEGLTSLEGPVDISGAVGISSNITSTGTYIHNSPNDTTSAIIINRSATLNPTTSADLIVINYKGKRTFIANEWGGPRVDVPTSADLGYNDSAMKLFPSFAGIDALQLFPAAGGSTPALRTREGDIFGTSLTDTGVVLGSNLTESAWTTLTIDSPTEAGKFTAGTPPLQIKAIDGGKNLSFRGRVNSVNNATANAVIVGAVPATIGGFNARPAAVRAMQAMGSGAGVRIELQSNGQLGVVGTAPVTYISFDGLNASLEA